MSLVQKNSTVVLTAKLGLQDTNWWGSGGKPMVVVESGVEIGLSTQILNFILVGIGE